MSLLLIFYLGVLAAIAIPDYQRFQQRAEAAKQRKTHASRLASNRQRRGAGSAQLTAGAQKQPLSRQAGTLAPRIRAQRVGP
jgi:type II secretory pathway pseudopilin PulG